MTNINELPNTPTMEPWNYNEDSHHIPRWLFRTWSPGSNGDNSATTFLSPASGNGKNITTLDGFEASQRKVVIEGHVRWWNLAHDPLISLSSSLIFVLQHGIYKISNPRHEYDVSRHTYLTMIDTSEIEGAFVPMIKVLQDCNLDEKTDRSLCHDYYTHEYAAQNFLVHAGHSVTFSFQQLADAGLFNILDDFKNPRMLNQLCARWLQLTIGDWFGMPWKTTLDDKAMIEKLVGAVEPRYRFMVALNVLSMKTRSAHDGFMHQMLKGYCTESEFDLDQQPMVPENVPTIEMQGAYRIANVVRAFEQNTAGLATIASNPELNAFTSVYEGLEYLIQSTGAVFEPVVQTIGCGSVARLVEISGGVPAIESKPPGPRPSGSGLITPPPSRQPTADGFLARLSSEFEA